MNNNLNNKKDEEKEDLNDEISNEIFGQSLNEVETEEINNVSDSEDIISDPNRDNKASGEALSGIRSSSIINKEYTDKSLDSVSYDVDADWKDDLTSEEVSMGENPTPDQDQVDSISEPWGTGYKDEDELNINKKTKELEQKRTTDEDEQ